MCKEHSLCFNSEKSKIMVFRKGGFLGKCERWSLGGNELEVVNSYAYLGYTFTTKLSLCQGVSPLAAKGKKATYDCVIVLRKFSELTRRTFFKMFDGKSNRLFCTVQKCGAFNVLMSLKKSTPLLVNVF